MFLFVIHDNVVTAFVSAIKQNDKAHRPLVYDAVRAYTKCRYKFYMSCKMGTMVESTSCAVDWTKVDSVP